MLGDLVMHCADQAQWLSFSNPIEIITARSANAVLPALHQIEETVQTERCYAAGYIAYEAAPAFDEALRVHSSVSALPLLWVALYRAAQPIELPPPVASAYTLGTWRPSVTWDEYERAIMIIKDHIAAGRTYQVNYTYRLRASFQGDPWSLFLSLAQQQTRYAAYLDLGRFAICSASPELFFQLNNPTLTARPMKGTAPRGKTLQADRAAGEWLHHSEKNRAENVMIVDMIRNDLGRIAAVGTVQVPRLFEVECYPTVLQMTSTVTAQSTGSLAQLMTALFPCASITGAPKVSTMQIIAELEPTPRGIYTGCIGYLAPDRTAQFNVAIRTTTIDRATACAEYGVGSGIVWDSDAADEYRECEIKTRVLTAQPLEFDLLEALLWTPTAGYFLLARHLARLRDSAAYFDRPLNETALREQLATVSHSLPPADHKVRVTLSREGMFTVTATPLSCIARAPVQRVALAPQPVDADDVFLYHKTSRRAVYDAARAVLPECDDVLLWNTRGELTESCTANLVIDLDGELITPPITCGLLGGTLRAELLAQQRLVERVIPIALLGAARQIFLINSVRKWLTAELIDAGKETAC